MTNEYHEGSGRLKKLLHQIASALVDRPEEVEVHEAQGTRSIFLELSVAKEDVGKVIGKQGHTADMIRGILMCASKKLGKHCILEILDAED
jgi:predicted RNA-binding protein YlqC (UPF0109 family)